MVHLSAFECQNVSTEIKMSFVVPQKFTSYVPSVPYLLVSWEKYKTENSVFLNNVICSINTDFLKLCFGIQLCMLFQEEMILITLWSIT